MFLPLHPPITSKGYQFFKNINPKSLLSNQLSAEKAANAVKLLQEIVGAQLYLEEQLILNLDLKKGKKDRTLADKQILTDKMRKTIPYLEKRLFDLLQFSQNLLKKDQFCLNFCFNSVLVKQRQFNCSILNQKLKKQKASLTNTQAIALFILVTKYFNCSMQILAISPLINKTMLKQGLYEKSYQSTLLMDSLDVSKLQEIQMNMKKICKILKQLKDQTFPIKLKNLLQAENLMNGKLLFLQYKQQGLNLIFKATELGLCYFTLQRLRAQNNFLEMLSLSTYIHKSTNQILQQNLNNIKADNANVLYHYFQISYHLSLGFIIYSLAQSISSHQFDNSLEFDSRSCFNALLPKFSIIQEKLGKFQNCDFGIFALKAIKSMNKWINEVASKFSKTVYCSLKQWSFSQAFDWLKIGSSPLQEKQLLEIL